MNHLLQPDIEERAGELAPILRGLLETQQKILDRLDAVEDKQSTMDSKLTDLVAAFPAGDTDGHRRYHQTMMDMLEERRRLRVAIQEKTISGLVWACIVFFGVSAAKYIRSLLGVP